jgi:hypothetical protein
LLLAELGLLAMPANFSPECFEIVRLHGQRVALQVTRLLHTAGM